MTIETHIRHAVATEPLDDYVDRRLGSALGRFADRIGRVTVRIADINGPRGGRGNQCRIVARLVPRGQIVIEETDSDALALIDRCADRLGRCVQRELKRRGGFEYHPADRPISSAVA